MEDLVSVSGGGFGRLRENFFASDLDHVSLDVDRVVLGETYFKLIIATGMRRGECCGLKWEDIDYQNHTIHIQRNVVKSPSTVLSESGFPVA